MNPKKHLKRFRLDVVWFAIGVFIIIGGFVSVEGFVRFPTKYGPNFYSMVSGMAFSAVISLLVIKLTFALQKLSKDKALNSARLWFLMQLGNELKDSYIRLVDSLQIRKGTSYGLDGKSWKGLSKEWWPKSQDVEIIQDEIRNASKEMPSSVDRNVDDAVANLQSVLERIINTASAKQLFEGQEYFENEMWKAGQEVTWLMYNIDQYVSKLGSSNKSEISQIWGNITNAILCCGDFLINLCKLSEGVNVIIKEKG